MEYNIGDKVKLINDNHGSRDLTVGKTYEVVFSDHSHKYDVGVIDDVGSRNRIISWSVIKLSQEKEPVIEFNIGDKVKLINDLHGGSSLTIGETYEVIATDPEPDDYYDIRVTNDRGNPIWIDSRSVINLGQEKEKVMEFNIGDKVKVINDQHGSDCLTIGETYVVVDIDPGDTYDVEVIDDVGYHNCIKSTSVINLSQEKTETLTLLDAINQLTLLTVVGMKGTDWSWYYQLGTNEDGDLTVVDMDGDEASLTWGELNRDAYIIKQKKELP